MKKLMVALAVVAMAAVSQAAQMKWGSGTLYVPGTASTKVSGSYGATASLYSLTSAQYSALTAAITTAGLTDANDISKYLYDTYKDATATKTGSFMNGVATLADTATYAKDDDAYGVVIYTTYDSTSKTGDLYYIANMGTVTFEADSTITQGNMGLKLNGTGDSISWQTVPEPTSGLLLLLGMAGLALRRKRA